MKMVPRLKFKDLKNWQQEDVLARCTKAGFSEIEIRNSVYFKVRSGSVVAFSDSINQDAISAGDKVNYHDLVLRVLKVNPDSELLLEGNIPVIDDHVIVNFD